MVNVPVALAVLLVATPAPLAAHDGAALFAEHCAPCHNIGETGGVGPDLRDIAKRKERAWLLAFVRDPASVNKTATMPPPDDLSRDAIRAILDYIDSRSASTPANAIPPEPPAPQFTPEDVARGGAIFAGTVRLGNGGPACLACHDSGLDGYLGGGTLGPSLARVATRLNGPKGTSAWLGAPPTPVMRAMFGASPLAPAEVHALTAFFVDRARPDAPVAPVHPRRFVAFGLAGAVAAFALIGAAWRGRLRPVRRALLARASDDRAAKTTHTHGFRSGGSR